MKRILIAAATAAALATSALAGVAPANAAGTTTAGLIEVGGQWNGGCKWNNGHGHWNGGKWNNGHSKWHGQPRWKAKRSCDPIVRWRMVGPRWHKRWDRVIVGWDCDRKHWRKHW